MRAAKQFIAAIFLLAALARSGYAEPATTVAPPRSEAARDATLLRAAGAARVSLTEAAAAVERETGGRVLSIVLGIVRGQPVYHVRLLAGGMVSTANVDAISGLPRLTDHAIPADDGGADIRREVAAAGRSSMTLCTGADVAARRTGGQPVEAWLVEIGGSPAYQVLTVVGDQVQQMTVRADEAGGSAPTQQKSTR